MDGKMKGITPVIAVILLLLITIAVVGFAFVWFQRIAQTTTDITEGELDALRQQTAKRVSIDAIDVTATKVSIRNRGTVPIPIGTTSEVSVYVGGALKTCTWTGTDCTGISAKISPGAVCTCDWPDASCTAGTPVRVTAPGGFDERTC